MKHIKEASWIRSPRNFLGSVTTFSREISFDKEIKKAYLEASALGVYAAYINGKKVGDAYLAPGWTEYAERIQVETYDVTAMLTGRDTVKIELAPGWKCGMSPAWAGNIKAKPVSPSLGACEAAAIFALTVEFADGSEQTFTSDSSWLAERNKYIESGIYDGYVYDANFTDPEPLPAQEIFHTKDTLVDRIGERITAHERLPVKEIIITPKGETVLDFGQNMTGFIEFRIKGKRGERALIEHGEVLDKDGNFYRDNLRSAKARAEFVCDGEEHLMTPEHTFFGFRYARLTGWSDEIKPENFTAVVVHSELKRTGYFECSDERVNKLFGNIIWGQKGNFLDVPTDCPQRDERLGWTGDAQVFVKTASYNFDVERFFEKWLADLRTAQRPWGGVPHVIPDVFDPDMFSSAAWADAATVCPWQMHLTYGGREIIEKSLDSMKRWIGYIDMFIRDGIWRGGRHFGDWLNLEHDSDGPCDIGVDKDLIATAFYIYSSEILIKSIELCGGDAEEYKANRQCSIEAFRREYMVGGKIRPEYETQTACVLASHFGISPDVAETAAQLNALVTACGHLKTGFVGTPYLLHVLSDNGYAETAYSLVLREEYPSWLFSVKMGATTVWEHWDSLRADGSMWSIGMNSFNHYAYGSVADWLYGDAAGIKTDESAPGFKHIIFAPLTDGRLSYVKASIESRYGVIGSEWHTENGVTEYIFTVPEGCTASVILGGKTAEIGPGVHKFN